MKLRSRDCSRVTTSEIRWSCSCAIRCRPAASFIYGCRRMRGADIVGRGFCGRLTRQRRGFHTMHEIATAPGTHAVQFYEAERFMHRAMLPIFLALPSGPAKPIVLIVRRRTFDGITRHLSLGRDNSRLRRRWSAASCSSMPTRRCRR